MALQNEAWFHHAVDGNVTHLAQKVRALSTGTTRRKDGVVGKSHPFNRMSSLDMVPVTTRDGQTQYANPGQSKRRAVLKDFALAVLIDDFDDIRTLTSPESEFAQALAAARERKMDDIVWGPQTVGGVFGLATTVDEAGESTGTSAITNVVAHGGLGMTMAKIRQVLGLMNNADVRPEDRYAIVSPEAILDLLADATVTSSDFSTLKALESGSFPMDATWMGFKWRTTTGLPKTGNIRSCAFYQKQAVGVAFGLIQQIRITENPERWNNTQLAVKLSGGSVRIDDAAVVEVQIDESV